MTAFNPVRGEAKVTIGATTITMALTMERLADLSTLLKCDSFPDLYRRLMGVEPAATMAAIRTLATGGERDGKPLKQTQAAAAALQDYSLSDHPALQVAFATLLAALVRDRDDAVSSDDGDADAGNRTAAPLN